jgi:hypothetical protein
MVLLAACSRGDPRSAMERPTAEEYAVWSAAASPRVGSFNGPFVVEERTASWVTESASGLQRLRENPGIPRELVEDYVARNGHPVRVEAGRLAAPAFRFLPDLSGPLGTVAGAASEGRLTLSRVGFDRGGTRALVMASVTCGALCGTGEMLVLERDGSGHWRRTSTVMLARY